MEANFFRALCRELASELAGSRIEKIWSPAPGAWTFGLGAGGGKRFLLYRSRPAPGLLFLSRSRPENPVAPPTRAMWFRKRLTGRRVVGLAEDWPRLRLALALSERAAPSDGSAPAVKGAGRFLLFDLRGDVDLVDSLPDGFGVEPDWPDPSDPELFRVLAGAPGPELWRIHPQLSPPARRSLAALAAADRLDEARALLEGLRRGEADAFHLYADASGPKDVLPFALPDALARGLEARMFPSALEAAKAHGEALLFAGLARAHSAEERSEETARRKRAFKALARIEEDERRLRGLAALGVQAEALQAELHRLGAGPVPARLRLEHPTVGPVAVELDPRLSPSANMERLFKLAAKGKRGLDFAARRKELFLNELDAAASWSDSASSASRPEGADGPTPDGAAKDRRATFQSAGAPEPSDLPPQKFRALEVKLFRSSDGFWMARGRNQTANHRLLTKAASPFDYWLHAEGGPGAHVVVKRDHPGQEVPRRTLLEAAALAGLASWRAKDAKAAAILAQVKDVRPMKGAALGEVRVDVALETLRADLDPDLETRLAVTIPTEASRRAGLSRQAGKARQASSQRKPRSR